MITSEVSTSLRQRGSILIMALVMLTILSVLAITQIMLNSTQTRIAANSSDREISFEKTEGAVNQAINYLLKGTYTAATFLQNSNGFYLYDHNTAPLWTTINWSGSTATNSFQGASGSQASYIIEKMPSVVIPGQNMKTPTNVYRITSRSVGANGNSSVVLQTTLQIQQ